MPSSVMLVALAVAWLVVLVPIVARRRQEVARTGAETLAARVVRSGGLGGRSGREQRSEEHAMSDGAGYGEDVGGPESAEPAALPGPGGSPAAPMSQEEGRRERGSTADGSAAGGDGELGSDSEGRAVRGREARSGQRPTERSQRYRPGRGGFDPEAAELAAQAKYAIRRRVVLGLLVAVGVSALLAGLVHGGLWWVNGTLIAGLIGYLGYLRRQVRLEDDIRRRRFARLGEGRSSAPNVGGARQSADGSPAGSDAGPPGPDADIRAFARADPPAGEVLELDDGDPAFHELSEPSSPMYRRAAG